MNLRNLAIFILVIAGGLMWFLIYDINTTERSLAHSLIKNPMQSAEVNLDRFFSPVENALLTSRDHAASGQFDSINPVKMNAYFAPIINNFPQISSMGLANTEGFEYDVIPNENKWDNRLVWIDQWGLIEKWHTWQLDSTRQEWLKLKDWKGQAKHDPRVRPWFTGALEGEKDHINWTDPYIYNTTFEAGITASVRWSRPGDDRQHIMAFDLTLADITAFTQELNVSKNGKVFVLSENGEYIGLPRDTLLSTKASVKESILKHPDSIDIPEISHAFSYWKEELKEIEESFEFESEEENWWGKLVKYDISPNRYLIVGVVIPEKDILSEVQRTKRVIIGSFIFVLILTGFVLYSYGQTRKANVALTSKNQEITEQKLIIEEKNKDIVDSIHYAKRLQNAILPPGGLVKELLPKSFILYKPKDIVAGDFYWLEKVDNTIYFAAADCTGHGVPGAMVSVVCSNALTKALIEEKITDPGKILDRTRELVIEYFGRSEDNIKDGMDIALCKLDLQGLKDLGGPKAKLSYAGANNPLWILRKGSEEVEEIKANKQPIGEYADTMPYTTHEVELDEGDAIYIFSDGYPDQFGGENGKKYKSGKMKKLLVSIQDKDMSSQHDLIDEEFESWRGLMEQIDDVCVIGVRI